VHRPIAPLPAAGHAKRFNLNRAQVVDQNFVEFVRTRIGEAEPVGHAVRTEVVAPDSGLTGGDLVELFESQIVARHQDIASREMRARNEGFYTIASAGHEGNAVVGRLTRHTDVAFLHYRSGAFMAERARKAPGIDFIQDTMLSFAASSDDPIAGGRHKALGSVPLWVPPQTSTIASHLPKAVGTALSLHRARRLGVENSLPGDTIVVCSFGDASVNHAVAQTAFNAAAWAAYQRLPVPILFVCEDNGIGISVETPEGWIEETYRNRRGLHYFQANGLDLIEAYGVTREAVAHRRLVPAQEAQKLPQRPGRLPGGIGHRLDALALQVAELPGHIRLKMSPIGHPAHAAVKLVKVLGQRRFDPENRIRVHTDGLLGSSSTRTSHRLAG